jgi:uncharacterized protein YcfJ
MNNTVLAGIIVGSVALAGAGAILANSGYNPFQKYAKVVSVEPAFDVTRTPRQVCGDEATLAQASNAGAASAAQSTTAEAAAAAPATAAEPKDTPVSKDDLQAAEGAAETECMTVFDTRSVQAGFDVTYELDGTQKVVRMSHDPGNRIPVEDGELVVSLR